MFPDKDIAVLYCDLWRRTVNTRAGILRLDRDTVGCKFFANIYNHIIYNHIIRAGTPPKPVSVMYLYGGRLL